MKFKQIDFLRLLVDQHYYVYIFLCADDSYYVVHKDDLDARLVAHQQKLLPCYTAKRLPVKLVFVEECGSRDAAFRAERMIKGWSRIKKQTLIKGGWSAMIGLDSKLKKEKLSRNKSDKLFPID